MLHIWSHAKTVRHSIAADEQAKEDWFLQRGPCACEADHRTVGPGLAPLVEMKVVSALDHGHDPVVGLCHRDCKE